MEERTSVMLAIKAVYDNGIVRWLENPPAGGLHDLIVLFEDVDAGLPLGASAHESSDRISEDSLQPLPELRGSMPDGWKEAVYGG
jgi:hypothetical protein